jgi:cephalosporin hydroxylase
VNKQKEIIFQRSQNIKMLKNASELKALSIDFMKKSAILKYSYNFDWLGRPIIQYPQDIIAVQEIIWKVRPDIIIETGIAHGGSLIFYASMLELIGRGEIVGIDIDIRYHNRREIENHPMSSRVKMIEGSSIDIAVVEKVYEYAEGKHNVLVCLDSNHTHSHVLKELELYSPLVKENNYIIVFDTIIEDLPNELFVDRPWNKKNNPKTAVREFLNNNNRFKVDKEFESKLLITVAPEGYLKCIKD